MWGFPTGLWAELCGACYTSRAARAPGRIGGVKTGEDDPFEEEGLPKLLPLNHDCVRQNEINGISFA